MTQPNPDSLTRLLNLALVKKVQWDNPCLSRGLWESITQLRQSLFCCCREAMAVVTPVLFGAITSNAVCFRFCAPNEFFPYFFSIFLLHTIIIPNDQIIHWLSCLGSRCFDAFALIPKDQQFWVWPFWNWSIEGRVGAKFNPGWNRKFRVRTKR